MSEENPTYEEDNPIKEGKYEYFILMRLRSGETHHGIIRENSAIDALYVMKEQLTRSNIDITNATVENMRKL